VTILTINVLWFINFRLSPPQVGDRYFTDVVYGNKNGFLTVLTEPLNITDESYIVKRVCFLFIL
jgi:predicted HAD superfamily phosphohydrolase YqeG